MNLRIISALALILSTAACVTPVVDDTRNEQQLAALQQQIIDMESAVSASIKSACEANTQALAREMHKDLRSQLATAKNAASVAKRKANTVVKQCDSPLAEKLVFGEIERVLFEDEKLSLDARIDTGAGTSSLGVYSLTKFERDGKDWVRFKLRKSKKAPFFEYRVRDDVKIKNSRQDSIEQRFEIKMDIRVGSKRYRRQVFNLADRSHLDFQVLLGRSFLRDIAIVDVSLKKQQSKKK